MEIILDILNGLIAMFGWLIQIATNFLGWAIDFIIALFR